MTVFKLVGLAAAAAAVAVLLRAYRPDMALVFSLAAGAALLMTAVGELTGALELIRGLIEGMGVDPEYVRVVLKVAGVACLVQFASNICRDAGESAIAGKVELVGRILLITAASPVVISIIELLGALLNVE